MNETAKAYWDLAVAWLAHAENVDDTNTTICYTGMAECALKMATFAVDNPYLIAGIDEMLPVKMPEGDIVNTVVSPAPTSGPKVWGAATP